jgi:hypothetical protein
LAAETETESSRTENASSQRGELIELISFYLDLSLSLKKKELIGF